MSTNPTPGPRVQPATGWFPKLKGTNLPREVVNGMQQSFSLTYSLRDTVNQQSDTIQKLLQYDTHRNRKQTRAQSMPDCMLWFESDRQTAFYQARLQPDSTTRDWYYAGGIYFAASIYRPSDLDSTHDTGFLFMGLDVPGGNFHLQRWNGTGWDVIF